MPDVTPHILLRSGNFFNFETPHLSRFTIEDVAYGLAHICRFTGQTSLHYSVAQHSIHAADMAPPELRFEALMHDAAESVIGDVSTPLKSLIPDYKVIEKRVEHVFADRFGFTVPMPAGVKEIDVRMLLTEREQLLPHTDLATYWPQYVGYHPYPIELPRMSPETAARAWLARYHDLRPR